MACDMLNITTCLVPKYDRLFRYFQGMANAHLRQIEPTRVMELLGYRHAKVPEDAIYGSMAASTVVLDDTSTKGVETVWALWWSKAIQSGHARWAFLPPTEPPGVSPINFIGEQNCMTPAFSARHTASSNSTLDSMEPYGSISISDGTVSAEGIIVGRCKIIRKLGFVIENEQNRLVRDFTLVLFAAGRWERALRIAAAFGGGRYTPSQRLQIAQALRFNCYRARLATLKQRFNSSKMKFRSAFQGEVFSDFMELQSVQMMVMNSGTAYLARLYYSDHPSDVVLVTSEEYPPADLIALDFNAVNGSLKSILTIAHMP